MAWKTHVYTRIAFRSSDGQRYHTETREIDDEEIYRQTHHMGQVGLLMLMDRWNRNGLLGIPEGGPIYVYHTEPTP